MSTYPHFLQSIQNTPVVYFQALSKLEIFLKHYEIDRSMQLFTQTMSPSYTAEYFVYRLETLPLSSVANPKVFQASIYLRFHFLSVSP